MIEKNLKFNGRPIIFGATCIYDFYCSCVKKINYIYMQCMLLNVNAYLQCGSKKILKEERHGYRRIESLRNINHAPQYREIYFSCLLNLLFLTK